jgi:hypothetical protein
MPPLVRIARSLQRRANRAVNEAERDRPLRVLHELAELAPIAEALERETVQAARTAGATWEQVAKALGVTRSAAHQRHAR